MMFRQKQCYQVQQEISSGKPCKPSSNKRTQSIEGRSSARSLPVSKGAFVWDQSGIRIIGIMRVSVCLGAILIPEYLDFYSDYSAPRSRIAGIYSGICSYSGISQTNAP